MATAATMPAAMKRMVLSPPPEPSDGSSAEPSSKPMTHFEKWSVSKDAVPVSASYVDATFFRADPSTYHTARSSASMDSGTSKGTDTVAMPPSLWTLESSDIRVTSMARPPTTPDMVADGTATPSENDSDTPSDPKDSRMPEPRSILQEGVSYLRVYSPTSDSFLMSSELISSLETLASPLSALTDMVTDISEAPSSAEASCSTAWITASGLMLTVAVSPLTSTSDASLDSALHASPWGVTVVVDESPLMSMGSEPL